MSLLESLLIVIIIVLTFFIVMRKPRTAGATQMWDCIDRTSGAMATVGIKHASGCSCPKCSNVEARALRENAEYFTECQDPNSIKTAVDNVCGEDDKFAYAVNDFGAPGMEYKDWVTSQAVDPQILKNQAEFVRDRLSNDSQNILGRTYSPDSHDSYDPIPWMGIRGRPQAVPMCNPTQMPDVNPDLFEKSQKVVWRTS